jgi:hypothetical protein
MWGAVTAMTAMPPEPDFSPQGNPGRPAEPPTVPRPVWPSPAYDPPAFPSPQAAPSPQGFPPPQGFPSPEGFPPPEGFPSPQGIPAPQSFAPPPVLPPPPEPSAQDLAGPRRHLRPLRSIGGLIWAAITVILAVGAVLEFSVGVYAGGVLCLLIAIGTGWYDYRIWRPKTRRDPR